MTRVLVQAVETKGADGEVFIRNTTHTDGGYYTASTAFTGTAGGGGAALSAGTQSVATGTVAFANSNGITFGMSGSSQITARHDGMQSLRVSVFSGSTAVSDGVSFGNANGITFNITGSTITASHNGLTSQSAQAVSAGNGSFTFQTLSLADSNGVSFSTGTQGVFASHNGLTSQSNQAVSAANGSSTFQTLSLANSNGVSFSTGTQGVFASHNGLTSQSNQALSAGNGSFAFQTASFSNANGVSFSTSAGSAIVASHNGLTSQSNQALSAANGSFTFQTASFANSNGVSFSTGTQGIFASHNGLTTQTNQSGNLSATGNTLGTNSVSATYNATGVIFAGSGVASVGVSNGSVVISVPAGGGGITAVNLSAGTTSNNLTAFTLSNSNNVSFGLNGSVITASASVATSLSNINVSAGTTSQNLSAVTFSNLNGVSFGLNGSVVTASVAAGGGGLTNINVSAGTTSNNLSALTFANSNGITFGLNASTVTASHNGLTSQSGQAFSAPGGSSAFQTLSFSNNANVSWTNSAGQVAASAWIQIEGGTQGGPGTIISFSNGNGVTFGNNSGTITASVAAAGGGATVSGWPNYPQGWATSNTSATFGNATALGAPTTSATITVAIAPLVLPVAVAFNEPRMIISQSLHGASTGSITQQHAFGIYTKNGASISLSTSYVWNMFASQNGSASMTVHYFFGTASNANSASVTASASSQMRVVTGIRHLVMTNAAHTLSAGHYFIGQIASRSSVGANVFQQSVGQISASQQTIQGAMFGSASTTGYADPYLALVTNFTTSQVNGSDWWLAKLPSAIGSTQFVRASAAGFRWPHVVFNSTG